MRFLIVEDDGMSRKMMQKFLSKYGECEVVIDGIQGMEAFVSGHTHGQPFDLICLDIMMPKLDGIRTLKAMRDFEEERGILGEQKAKIIMTTALNDQQSINSCYEIGCDGYAWKPIDIHKFVEVMKNLNIIEI